MYGMEKQNRVRIAFCLDLWVNAVENAINNHFDGKQFTSAVSQLRNTII